MEDDHFCCIVADLAARQCNGGLTLLRLSLRIVSDDQDTFSFYSVRITPSRVTAGTSESQFEWSAVKL